MEQHGLGENGGLKPCWFAHDCQLAQDQREANIILHDILAEARTMKQVSSQIYFLTVGIFGILVLVLILRDSRKDFHASAAGANLHITSASEMADKAIEDTQKKTGEHEGK